MTNTRQFRTPADIKSARRDTAWHEDAMSVLTFPTAPPVAFFSYDNPKSFGGVTATVGDIVTKDDAGNFTVDRIEEAVQS